jgi:catechol 2,3-dioxygenase-like lactoylglutathione lyase family enzyme
LPHHEDRRRPASLSVLELNHCNLIVPRAQLAALVAFYVDALGLEYRQFEAAGRTLYWLYAGERPLVHLTLVEGEARAAVPPATVAPAAPIDHIAFSATDLAGVCARLERLRIEHRVKPYPQMGFTQVVLHDPIGLKVELNFSDQQGPSISSTGLPR